MNSGFLILSVLGALGVGHAGLRKSIESAYPPDPDRTTPAYSLRDDVDFIPAAPFVLFGHHWMSIAGKLGDYSINSWISLGLVACYFMDGIWSSICRCTK